MFPTTEDIELHFAAHGIADPEPLMKAFAINCGFDVEGMRGHKLERIVATRWKAFTMYQPSKKKLKQAAEIELYIGR